MYKFRMASTKWYVLLALHETDKFVLALLKHPLSFVIRAEENDD